MRLFGGQKVQEGQRASGEGVSAAYVPKTPNLSLGQFGAYSSKAQFMVDWAADIFREAGKDPNDHAGGVQEMANIASFTQIWYRLRAVATSNGDKKSIKYLDSLDRGNLLAVLDIAYPTAMKHIAKGAGCWAGPMADMYIANLDNTFDEVFVSCRVEFVEGVLKGDF